MGKAGAGAGTVSSREGQFREDGAAAVDWVASYLERLRDYPVLAQVEPGELRSLRRVGHVRS